MLLNDHHDWVQYAASRLMLGSETLWQAMCSEWTEAQKLERVRYIVDAIGDALA